MFLQKTLKNSVLISSTSIFLIIILSAFKVVNKSTVTFSSDDKLQITADEYIIAEDNPYILLFHQQESSRGEYSSIAPKLNKMDYNCLAVDIRNGGNDNPVSNETVKSCRESRCSLGFADVENDILAAVNYAYEKSGKPVVLMGSGANASLCLKITRENDNVRAVIAMSPGEYFLPELNIRDTISGMRKPVFLTSSLSDAPYLEEMVSGISEKYLELFIPQMGEGARGTRSLLSTNENNSEYWLALLLFFKELR